MTASGGMCFSSDKACDDIEVGADEEGGEDNQKAQGGDFKLFQGEKEAFIRGCSDKNKI